MHIGFLGLGAMGKPLAGNLLGLGHTVTVYNRTPGQAKALIALGAKEAATVAEAVMHAEVAITVLSDDAAVAAVVHGPGGLIQHLPPKGIHLCMTTIGIEASAQLASAHAQADQGYVAAPIFGRAQAAASRHIWFVAGGPEPQVNRCLPIFVALGRGLTRVGPKAALAHALKVGGNAITEALLEALPDILTSCEKAGMASTDYLRILNTEIFKSPMAGVLEGVVAPSTVEPPDLSLDYAANEMLTVLQASGLEVAPPMVDRPNAKQRGSAARGRGGEALLDPSRVTPLEAGLEGAVAPEPKAAPPVVIPSAIGARRLPKPKRPPDPKGVLPPRVEESRPAQTPVDAASVVPAPGKVAGIVAAPAPLLAPPLAPPPVAEDISSVPTPTKAVGFEEVHVPPPLDPSCAFTAMDGGDRVTLDLNGTSHFEVIKGQVWAWSQGKRYLTAWRSLGEVTLAFNHVLLLLIQRHVLLRPEAVLDLRTTFGGGAKAQVGETMVLDVSRAAAPRLKVLLGL